MTDRYAEVVGELIDQNEVPNRVVLHVHDGQRAPGTSRITSRTSWDVPSAWWCVRVRGGCRASQPSCVAARTRLGSMCAARMSSSGAVPRSGCDGIRRSNSGFELRAPPTQRRSIRRIGSHPSCYFCASHRPDRAGGRDRAWSTCEGCWRGAELFLDGPDFGHGRGGVSVGLDVCIHRAECLLDGLQILGGGFEHLHR